VKLSICTAAVLLTLFVASNGAAQDSGSRPHAEVKINVGATDFGDDNESYPHFMVGTAMRIRISRHWSVEPEFNYMRRSSNDEDYVVQPNVVYEFTTSDKRVVPYLIGGVGVIRHKSVYNDTDFVTGAPITFDTSWTTWSASGGAGLKIFVSKHLFVAPEARIGYQPTLRANVSIGYAF
jgi:hypothetical protein